MTINKKPKCDDCKNIAAFECESCGMLFCKEHEDIYEGECPYCAPRLIPIKKKKK